MRRGIICNEIINRRQVRMVDFLTIKALEDSLTSPHGYFRNNTFRDFCSCLFCTNHPSHNQRPKSSSWNDEEFPTGIYSYTVNWDGNTHSAWDHCQYRNWLVITSTV
ncbi:MAG: hypothetical protein ACI837_003019 [Crocinitomicaceae bacterium]